MSMIILPAQDAFELARQLAGLERMGLPVQQATEVLLTGYDPENPFHREALLRVLERGGVLQQILTVDPNSPPSSGTTGNKEVRIQTPPLPQDAQLSDKARKQAENVASWYGSALDWAIQRSPMTPIPFMKAMLIWLLGLATARRIAIQLHDTIFAHLYLLIIAESSKYAKTTGMYAVDSLGRAAFPWMYIPHQSSPEGLLEMLAGELPANFEKLRKQDQELITAGRTVAAQRGMVSDEYSGYLSSRKKDYMQGQTEFLLRAYDAQASESYYTKSGGISIVKHPGISILGAVTPRGLALASSEENWETGEFARYLMLLRDEPLPYNPNYISPTPPKFLVDSLRALNQFATARNDPQDPSVFEVIQASISKDARKHYNAYTKAVFYDMLTENLDFRLHPNYRRMPVQVIKMALGLAAMDWAQAGGIDTPRIEMGHLAVAQELGEQARESLHRLLPILDESRDSKIQRQLEHVLAQYPQGITARDLGRSLGKLSKDIEKALDVLIESGIVYKETVKTGGRSKVMYRLLP